MTMISPNSDVQNPYDSEVDGDTVESLEAAYQRDVMEFLDQANERFGQYQERLQLLGGNHDMTVIVNAIWDATGDAFERPAIGG